MLHGSCALTPCLLPCLPCAAAFALMTLKGWIKVAQLEKKEKQLLGIA